MAALGLFPQVVWNKLANETLKHTAQFSHLGVGAFLRSGVGEGRKWRQSERKMMTEKLV